MQNNSPSEAAERLVSSSHERLASMKESYTFLVSTGPTGPGVFHPVVPSLFSEDEVACIEQTSICVSAFYMLMLSMFADRETTDAVESMNSGLANCATFLVGFAASLSERHGSI